MPVFITTSDIYTQIWEFNLKNSQTMTHVTKYGNNMCPICQLIYFQDFSGWNFSKYLAEPWFCCIYHTKIIKNVEIGQIVRGFLWYLCYIYSSSKNCPNVLQVFNVGFITQPQKWIKFWKYYIIYYYILATEWVPDYVIWLRFRHKQAVTSQENIGTVFWLTNSKTNKVQNLLQIWI